jgi:HAD superfamily hydrolase (TIGR01490 family)
MSRSFAVFDIDGTIIRWQLYHAVSDQLAKNGQIDKGAFERVRQTRMNWKRRAGEDSFQEYEMDLVQVFDDALAGMTVAELTKAADEAFEEYKDQVYTYTRDLIRQLQAKNYLLFAISGSPDIIVEKLAGYYGFDDFMATSYPARAGRFIGTKELSIGKKPQLLEQLISKHGASLKNSIAVGDSESDITMLEMVERPIAFNPSKKLFNHALKQGWNIILERKNVVYKLNSENNKYVLKN